MYVPRLPEKFTYIVKNVLHTPQAVPKETLLMTSEENLSKLNEASTIGPLPVQCYPKYSYPIELKYRVPYRTIKVKKGLPKMSIVSGTWSSDDSKNPIGLLKAEEQTGPPREPPRIGRLDSLNEEGFFRRISKSAMERFKNKFAIKEQQAKEEEIPESDATASKEAIAPPKKD